MITIIVDNHAHRLLQSGVVESVELGGGEKRAYIPSEGWKIVSPEQDLGIHSGDFHAFIKKQLEVLHAVFPADRLPMPSSEKQETIIQQVNAIRV